MISLDQLPADEKLKLIYILVFTSEFLYLSYSTRGFLFSRSSSPPKLFYERGKQSWLENWQEYSQETCCRLQLCRKRDFDTGFILNFVKLFGTTLLQNTFGQMHVDLLCFSYKASPLFSKHNLLTSDSCFSCSGSSMYIYLHHTTLISSFSVECEDCHMKNGFSSFFIIHYKTSLQTLTN